MSIQSVVPFLQQRGHHIEKIDMRIMSSYGVKWTLEKTCRDVLQNFYDANDQNLDNVRVESDKTNNLIFVRGEKTFGPDLVTYLGGTSKKGDNTTAGGFGEGIKIASLILLRDFGALEVTIGSKDWKAVFTIESGILHCELHKGFKAIGGNIFVVKIPNSVQFTNMLRVLNAARNLFYHSENEDFRGEFELKTSSIMIKVLPRAGKDKGNLYVNGQRFHYKDDKWNTLEGMTINIRDKSLVPTDRDRGVIEESVLRKVLEKVVSKMSKKQRREFLVKIQDRWHLLDPDKQKYLNSPLIEFVKSCLGGRQTANIVERILGTSIMFSPSPEIDRFTFFGKQETYYENNERTRRYLKYIRNKGLLLLPPFFSYHLPHGNSVEVRYQEDSENKLEKIKPKSKELRRMFVLLYEGFKLMRTQTSVFVEPEDIQTSYRPVRVVSQKALRQDATFGEGTQGFHEYKSRVEALNEKVFRESSYGDAIMVYIHELSHEHGFGHNDKYIQYLNHNFARILHSLLDHDQPDTQKRLERFQAYTREWTVLQERLNKEGLIDE